MPLIGIDASRANATDKTGTEWYSWYIIRAMAQLPDSCDYLLYAKERLQPGLLGLPRARERVLTWPPRRLWTHTRLAFEMFRHPPDVLFVPAHTIPIVHPRATVTTAHDVGFVRYPELYSKRELLYHRWSMNFALRHARRIIAPSYFTKAELLELYGVNPDRIVVIHHGFDTSSFRVIEDQKVIQKVLDHYGIHTPFFLFVGRLQHKKNILGLTQAFHLFTQTYREEETQLVLVGQPDYGFEQVRRFLTSVGINNLIIQPGYVPQVDMPFLMNAASAFVFPSFYEGFGFPILEAQACGTPVITSRRASLPEVGGQGALYIDPKDTQALAHALQNVLNNNELRAHLIQEGLTNLERFTWNQAGAQTRSVLLESIKRD